MWLGTRADRLSLRSLHPRIVRDDMKMVWPHVLIEMILEYCKK